MFAPSKLQYCCYAAYKLQEQLASIVEKYTFKYVLDEIAYDNMIDFYENYYVRAAEKAFKDYQNGTINFTTYTKIIDKTNAHYRAFQKEPWYNRAVIIKYEGMEDVPDTNSFKYAVYDFTIDKAKFNEIKDATTDMDEYTPLQLTIFPIITIKLGPISQMMFKGMSTSTFVPEYHDGEYLRVIPNNNIQGYGYSSEYSVSIKNPIPSSDSILRKDDSKIEVILDDEDVLGFKFKVPLFHYYEWQILDSTKIDYLPSYFSKDNLTAYESASMSIDFIFPQAGNWAMEPNYLYWKDTLVGSQMIKTINYSNISPDDIDERLNTYPYTPYTYDEPTFSSDFDLRHWKVESPSYTSINEKDWWMSHFRWSITDRPYEYAGVKHHAYYFTTNIPTYGINYLGDAGAYFSYTTSSLPDQTKGSSGVCSGFGAPGVICYFKTGTGYYTNGLLVRIPETEIINNNDMQAILCQKRMDDRCLIGYDINTDFTYINKYYYPGKDGPEYWTFGSGSKSVPKKALDGYVTGSLMGLLCGFGATWRTI